MRTGAQPGFDDAVGVRMQRPAHARASLARRTKAIGWDFVLLLPLRRRFGGVVRCLRRASQGLEPRFQRFDAALLFGNDDQRRVQPHGQRCDQRVLLGVAQAGEVGGRGHPAFRIDSAVVVSRVFQCRSGQAAKPNKGTRDAMITPGVSNYSRSAPRDMNVPTCHGSLCLGSPWPACELARATRQTHSDRKSVV